MVSGIPWPVWEGPAWSLRILLPIWEGPAWSLGSRCLQREGLVVSPKHLRWLS